jgi:hypothetical protein
MKLITAYKIISSLPVLSWKLSLLWLSFYCFKKMTVLLFRNILKFQTHSLLIESNIHPTLVKTEGTQWEPQENYFGSIVVFITYNILKKIGKLGEGRGDQKQIARFLYCIAVGNPKKKGGVLTCFSHSQFIYSQIWLNPLLYWFPIIAPP